MSTEPLPEQIGPYRIESEVGRGMMGVVYKARDSRHRRRLVALKVVRILFPVSDEQRVSFEKRFIQEAKIVARLSHPGIVGVYDVGRDKRDGAPYMALEFLEGRTLAAIQSEGPPLTWRESLGIVGQVAETLHYAHAHGVVHRDIKPANVMVLDSGRPKIMDFGLAKHQAGMEMTSTGQFMGTPLYMSPEQASGEKVDTRTDIFSLGSVAYTLLTGKRAFEADSVPQVMNKVAHQLTPPPTQLSPVLPPEVDYLIARAMAKRRDDRYPDGRTFAEDIADVLKGRRPRHQKGWKAPVVGDGTIVSERDSQRPSGEVGDVELEPLEEPIRRRGAGPMVVLGFSVAALGAVVLSSAFWRAQIAEKLGVAPAPTPAPIDARALLLPVPSPAGTPTLDGDVTAGSTDGSPSAAAGDEATATESAASPPPEPGLVPVALLPPEPTTSPKAGAATASSTPPPMSIAPAPAVSTRPSASPISPSPSRSAAPMASAPVVPSLFPPTAPPVPSVKPVPLSPSPRPTTPPRPTMGRLAISFEHGLKSGTLRILIDRELVLEQKLTSRVTKDLLLFKLRSGSVRDVLPVTPGKRRIRVEVKTIDETRVKEISTTVRSGATRRLEIRIGRAKGSLTLTWK